MPKLLFRRCLWYSWCCDSFLATFPINAVLYNPTDLENVATLNPIHGIILIVISTILTMIGVYSCPNGSEKDAAVALRANK